MKPTSLSVSPGRPRAAAEAQGLVARVRGYIGRPLGRGVLVLCGLVVLSLVGRFAAAGGQVPPAATGSASALAAVNVPAAVPVSTSSASSGSASGPAFASASASASASPPVPHAARATADDPVFLNDATVDDLRRLPGIGPKRALAVLDLRKRLGRFRQVEDLLRVRGIGRSTLRKLRPLVRLDHPTTGDGGAP